MSQSYKSYNKNLFFACQIKNNSTFASAYKKFFIIIVRGVAQLVIAPGLGPGGRKFESCRPDIKLKAIYEFRFVNRFQFIIDSTPQLSWIEQRFSKTQAFGSNPNGVTQSQDLFLAFFLPDHFLFVSISLRILMNLSFLLLIFVTAEFSFI